MEQDDEALLEYAIFDPPLYRQRYLKVIEILEHSRSNIAKVIDIGCSNLGFFTYLKTLESINNIVLIDKDLDILKDNSRRIDPLPAEYLFRRKNSLDVSILQGDAKFFHERFKDVDAVTMIEVIEHIETDEIPPIIHNVFSHIKPKIVIITTPNSDYNIYFPGLPFGKLRHHDHKFEWSKEQFANWASSTIKKYSDYSVRFSGCGCGPLGIFCSQIAIFEITPEKFTSSQSPILEDTKIIPIEPKQEEFYLVHKVSYPYDHRTAEEKQTDNLSRLAFNLRRWLIQHFNQWDMDTPLTMIYQANVISWDLINKFNDVSISEEKDTSEADELTSCSSGENSMNVIPGKISSAANPLFKLVALESSKGVLESNVFYYDVDEDRFIFLRRTLHAWMKCNSEETFEGDVDIPGMEFQDFNGNECAFISYV